MYYVYILRSLKNNQYYIGSTDDIDSRLKRHNAGYVRSTKPYLPWSMIYFETHENRSQAVKREMEIKSWKSRARVEKLINMAPSSSG